MSFDLKEDIVNIKELISSGNTEEAFNMIREKGVNVEYDADLSVFYINHLMEKGEYDESMLLISKVKDRFVDDVRLKDICDTFSGDTYDTKAKKYNKEKRKDMGLGYDLLDCLCDYHTYDICIKRFDGDKGFIDLDDCF